MVLKMMESNLYISRGYLLKRYWEPAPHTKNPKKYPNIVDLSEFRL